MVLHGVGVSCVNALSSKQIVTVEREGKKFRQTYSEGKPTSGVEVIGESDETGTHVHFYPDATIFKTTEFKFSKTSERLRELAFLNPSVSIRLIDEKEELDELYKYEGGLRDFVNYIDEGNSPVISPIQYSGSDTGGLETVTEVDICFTYNNSYSETVLSYVNNINTIEGGTHVSGFRAALTRTMNFLC